MSEPAGPRLRRSTSSLSVAFNLDEHESLVNAYAGTADALQATGEALTPLLLRAQDLLSQRTELSVTHSLARIAEELAEERVDLRRRFDALQAADARTTFLLSISAERLINVELAADAIHSGWSYDEAILRHELRDLAQLPRPLTAAQHERLTELESVLDEWDHPHSAGGTRGDLDSDLLTPRLGAPLRIGMLAAPPAERGSLLARRALDDMAQLDQIQEDEFEVYFHDNGKLTFVLPGVIDLRSPRYGLDTETRSLRDLDQGAIRSAFSTDLDDSGYAERIREWAEVMIDTGIIDPGTQVSIIGHSYGADAAFDLAADERFNGELLEVTHALALGYHSRPQLHDLPPHTEALAVVNNVDVVVMAERLAEGIVSLPAPAFAPPRESETETEPETEAVSSEGEPSEGDRGTAVTPTGYLIEFDGGFAGLGHDPSEYGDYLEKSQDPVVVEFLSQLDANGYTNDAVAVSVDVSAPLEQR